MTDSLALQVATQDLDHPDLSQMNTWVQAALDHEGAAGEICLRVVDEAEITELNQQYRGKPGSTNVLSFPAELPPGVPLAILGDLVVCAPLVEREAAQQDKTTSAHWAHLLVHGTLHLLGYDHQASAEAELMEAREVAILNKLGFANPYA